MLGVGRVDLVLRGQLHADKGAEHAAGELIDAAKNGWRSKHVSAKDLAAGCLGGVTGAFAGVYIAPNRIVWTRQF